MFADYSQWEQWRGVKVEEAIAPGATGVAVYPAAASST
jgi:ABC transport system ATP-binding/permease protein